MKKFAAAAFLSLAPLSAAYAAPPPTINFTAGVYAIPGYTTAQVFENFEGGAGGGAQYTPAQGSGANPETVSGTVRTYTGTVPGQAVNPDADANKYLAVENGSFTVAFGVAQQFFSFVLGTLDAYNSLVLNFSDGTSQTFTGAQIIGQSGAGPFNSPVSGRVSFDFNGGPGLLSAIFSSSQAAFEIDDLASAVPEPGTWLMMLLGFGLVGASLRRKPKFRRATA